MPSHVFDSSVAADRAAKKAGRFFAGKVYNTKGQADAARKARASVGARNHPGGVPVGPRARQGQQRATEVVVISERHAMRPGSHYISVDMLSEAAAPGLLALVDRKAKILGVRAQVCFPLLEGKTRWAIAVVHKLSAGDKTVQQISTVRGAQVFDSGDFVDKWLTLSDISGVINPRDVNDNSMLKDTDQRHVVFAVETTADSATVFTVNLHVTVQVDSAVAAAVTDL